MSNITAQPVELTLYQLDTSVGLFLNGYFLTMILYGFIAFQSYIYYSTFMNDSLMLKSVVLILSALDTAAAVTKATHSYIILQFPLVDVGIDDATNTYIADFGLAVISIGIVQLAYTHRVWKIGKSIIVAVLMGLCAGGALALGLVETAQLAHNPAFNALENNPSKAVFASCQALTFAASCLAFGTLFMNTQPKAKYSKAERSIQSYIDSFMSFWIARGGAAMLIQLIFLISFVAAPSRRFWMPAQLVSRRMFILSFLTMLDTRCVVRGRGFYEEDTLLLSQSSGDKHAKSSEEIVSAIQFRKVKQATEISTPSMAFPIPGNKEIGMAGKYRFEEDSDFGEVEISAKTRSFPAEENED